MMDLTKYMLVYQKIGVVKELHKKSFTFQTHYAYHSIIPILKDEVI